MISVAAELAGMHPQTLRIYEARGLIPPKRSPKNTRLYSQEDVERLRRIQELTTELGMNLAGVERVFELEQEIERMRRRMRKLERQAGLRSWRRSRRVRRSIKAEHRRTSSGRALVPPTAGTVPCPSHRTVPDAGRGLHARTKLVSPAPPGARQPGAREPPRLTRPNLLYH